MGQRSWNSCKTFAIMGLVFSAAECVIEKARAKHDTTNTAVAGCVTGGSMSARDFRIYLLMESGGLRTASLVVADEFIKRRHETKWFVEGDFDTYVTQIRKPHVWGGEPELFMASHVLQMPITVYMKDDKAGGLICIAEYGQEYDKDDPIRVLYYGFGHYDALMIHESKTSVPKAKL